MRKGLSLRIKYLAFTATTSAAIVFNVNALDTSKLPRSKVVYDNKGAGIMVEGRRVPHIEIALPPSMDPQYFNYELDKAIENNVPIAGVCLTPYVGSGPWANKNDYDDLIARLKRGSDKQDDWPYVILSFGLHDFYSYGYGLPPLDKRMQVMSRDGTVRPHNNSEPLSADWIERSKRNISLSLEYFSQNYPGKVIAVHYCYLAAAEWLTENLYWNPKTNDWYTWADAENTPPAGTPAYFTDYSSDMQARFNSEYGYPAARALPTVLQRCIPSYGNYFHTAANTSSKDAIRFNRFHSKRVTDAILALAKYTKSITDNKTLVRVFAGYLNELSFSRGADYAAGNVGSGHTDMKRLLEDPNLDIVGGPYSYACRMPGDNFWAHGPMDSYANYKVPNPNDASGYSYKMWFNEDDTRTFLSKYSGTDEWCNSALNFENTKNLVRRNIIANSLHKTGWHLTDLYGKGWWGMPDHGLETGQLWTVIKTTMDQCENMDFSVNNSFVPEVAVFCDDASMSLEMLESFNSPGNPKGVPQGKYSNMREKILPEAYRRLTKIGAPVRYYLVSDILRNEFPADKIKVAVFLNTYKLTGEVRLAINNKLKSNGKTLLFIYAAGIAKDDDVLDNANIGDITGLPVLLGSGGYNLNSWVDYGTDSDLYQFHNYYGDMQFDVEPWFYVDGSAQGVTVLGKYKASLVTHPAHNKNSVVMKDCGTHKVIYSASPDLPVEMYRAIAGNAGVNIWSSDPSDVIDAGGNTLMVQGMNAQTWRTITFPFEPGTVQLMRLDGSQNITVGGKSMQLLIGHAGESVLLRWASAAQATGEVLINENALTATAAKVDLTLSYTPAGGVAVNTMRVWEDGGNDTGWISFMSSMKFALTAVSGVKRVKAQFCDQSGRYSDMVFDEITLVLPLTPILIESGAEYTNSTTVALSLSLQGVPSSDKVRKMMFSNDGAAYSGAVTFSATASWAMLSGDGVKTVYVKFVYEDNTQSNAYSDTIFLDTVAPAGTVRVKGGDPYTRISYVELTLSASDNEGGSGIDKMMFSTGDGNWTTPVAYNMFSSYILPAGDGVKTIYVKFTDKADNVSAQYSDDIIFDTTPPSGKVIINDDKDCVYTRQVTLTLEAADAWSGVSKMCFTVDGVNLTSWEDFAVSRNIPLSEGLGTKIVSVKFMDGAGNESGLFSDTIILKDDTIAPTGTITINNGHAYTSSLTVTLNMNAVDNEGGSGVVSYVLSEDQVIWSAPQGYPASPQYTFRGDDGTKTIYAKYKDAAGNESQVCSASIILDRVVPQGAISMDYGRQYVYTNKQVASVHLELSATDDRSGVGLMEFSDNGTDFKTPEEYKNAREYVLTSGPGPKTVHVRFIDMAGNRSIAYSASITVVIDIQPPTGSVLLNDGKEYGAYPVTVTLSAADDNEEYQWCYVVYSTDMSTWTQPEIFRYSQGSDQLCYMLTKYNMENTLYVKFIDLAGNESQVYSDKIIIDAEPPSVSMTVNNGGPYIRARDVTLHLEAADNLSGVTTMSFYDSDGTITWPEPFNSAKAWTFNQKTGVKTIKVSVMDTAGNSRLVTGSVTYDPQYLTGNVYINNNSPVVYKRDVTLFLPVYTGAEYIASVKLSNDGANWTEPIPYKEEIPYTLTAEEGEKTVYAVFIDKWQTESAVRSGRTTLRFDTIPPSNGSVEICGGVEVTYERDVTLTLCAQDNADGSGVKWVTYSEDGNAYTEPVYYYASGIHYYTLSFGDGEKKVYVKFIDAVGNISEAYSDTILLKTNDHIPPSGAVTIEGGAISTESGHVTLSLNAFDMTPGDMVCKMKFSNDNNDYTSPEVYAESREWDLAPGVGRKTVYVKFGDRYNNWSAPCSAGIILGSGPQVSLAEPRNGGSSEFQEVFITVRYSDSNAGGIQNLKTCGFFLGNDAATTVFLAHYQVERNELHLWPNNDGFAPGAEKVLESSHGGFLDCKKTAILPIDATTIEIKWCVKIRHYGTNTRDIRAYCQNQLGLNCKDKIGSWTVTPDITPPTGTVNINNGAKATNTPDVMLNFNAQDDNIYGKVVKTRMNYTGTGNPPDEPYAASKAYSFTSWYGGIMTVYARFEDASGNMSDWVNDSIILDQAAPTGGISINGGAGYLYTNAATPAVTLSLEASDDNAGVDKMRFSDDGIVYTQTEDYAAAKTYCLPAGDGTKNVYVKYIDAAGNESGAYSAGIIKVTDIVPPAGTISINGGAQFAQSVNVALDLSFDDHGGSGVDRMRFSTDNIAFSAPEPMLCHRTFTLPGGNGLKTVYVKFIDRAGNESPVYSGSITLNLTDKTAPSGSININYGEPETGSRMVTLNLAATDEAGGSGVFQMQLNNEAPEAYAPVKQWLLDSAVGEQYVSVKYCDYAGNWSGKYFAKIRYGYKPQIDALSQMNGSSYDRDDVDFTVMYKDMNPAGSGSELADCTFWVGEYPYELYLQYNAITKIMYLRYGGNNIVFTPGEPKSAENPVCIIDCQNTTVARVDANTVLMNCSVRFKYSDNFKGIKNVFASAKAGTNFYSSAMLGTWAIKGIGKPTGSVTINSANDDHSISRTSFLQLNVRDENGKSEGCSLTLSKDGSNWDGWRAFDPAQTREKYLLTAGSGTKTVYAKYRDVNGNESAVVQDSIVLNDMPKMAMADTDGTGEYGLVIGINNETCLNGLWIVRGSGVSERICYVQCEGMAAGDFDNNGKDDMALDFGPAYGLYIRYADGEFVQLNALDPEVMAAGNFDNKGGDDLLVDFGALEGMPSLWIRYDVNDPAGAWEAICWISPENIITGEFAAGGADEIVGDFGDLGIYMRCNTAWGLLSGIDPEDIDSADINGNGKLDLVMDFAKDYGVWVMMDDRVFKQLVGISCKDMTAADINGDGREEVVGDFDRSYGIWAYDDVQGKWAQVVSLCAVYMSGNDLNGDGKKDLWGDFGAQHGVWALKGNKWEFIVNSE